MDIPLWRQIMLQILLQIVLILLNAVFACAEIAVIETKGAKLAKLAEDGNKRAVRLKRLADNPAKFLASIQVAITLSGFLASAFAAENFSVYIVNALHGKTGLSDSTVNTVSVILITVILSYFTLVFGELVPKRLAMKKPEKIALGVSGTVRFISVAFAPLVWLLTLSTNAVLRVFGLNTDESETDGSEADIRMMADAGSEMGFIDENENEMIQNVFEFDDISVGEIATHRTEAVILWADDSDDEWYETVKNKVHSYYPVCSDSIDKVVGILDAEKYLRLDDKCRKNVMEKAVEKPHFAAGVMKADVLFREMKQNSFSIATVVDEYGGVWGIITLNDLVEQIVGDLGERDNTADYRKSGGGYIFSGLCERNCFDRLFGIETDGNSCTLGGWVMETLGKIPSKGEKFISEGVSITVTQTNAKRILEVYAEKSPESAVGNE